MSHKRKATECHLDIPLNKKRKLNKSLCDAKIHNNKILNQDNKDKQILQTKIFQHYMDKQQYQRIFTHLESCPLIKNNKMEINLIKIISEYGTGQLIGCYKCGEMISFLEMDLKLFRGKKCTGCNLLNWCVSCDVHKKVCTGTRCKECSAYICVCRVKECDYCQSEFCLKCFPESGEKCWSCHMTDYPIWIPVNEIGFWSFNR